VAVAVEALAVDKDVMMLAVGLSGADRIVVGAGVALMSAELVCEPCQGRCRMGVVFD
jgi:hypothetical protein